MKKLKLFNKTEKKFDTKSLPKDSFVVEKLKTNTDHFEYIVINVAYKKFNLKGHFYTAIKLVFTKEHHNDFNRNLSFNHLEFKLIELILKIGNIILIYRKERLENRETLFYISSKAAKQLSVFNLNEELNYEIVQVTIKKDINWKIASQYLE